jgi:hypothetical protein
LADLSILTANSQVEVALQTTIALGIQKRLTLATTAALEALASAARTHLELAYTTATAQVWQFNRFSQAAASASVLVPDDAPTAGRWLLTSSTSSSGYLNAVTIYDGEPDEESVYEWLFGQVPNVVIVWDGDDYEPKSGGSPGALYRTPMRFSIWAISRNLRGQQQGITGSQIASEAAADPGVNRILGDLRRYLAGSDLNQDGVNYCEIVSADRVLSSKTKNRGHVYRLSVKVYATIHNTVADDADNPATDLDRVDTELQWAQATGADESEFADGNYLSSGGGLSSSTGLAATYASGVYVIDGTEVAFGSDTETLTASKVTFRYVDDVGAITYVTHADDGTVPETPADTYLIGATTTDATGVAIDRLLAPMLADSGITDQIDVTE